MCIAFNPVVPFCMCILIKIHLICVLLFKIRLNLFHYQLNQDTPNMCIAFLVGASFCQHASNQDTPNMCIDFKIAEKCQSFLS